MWEKTDKGKKDAEKVIKASEKIAQECGYYSLATVSANYAIESAIEYLRIGGECNIVRAKSQLKDARKYKRQEDRRR